MRHAGLTLLPGSAVASSSGLETDLFPGGLEANFVRVIWQQMLKAVHAMHEERVRSAARRLVGLDIFLVDFFFFFKCCICCV